MVDNRWRWFVNALSFGFALAAMSIPLAWTISIVRVAPQRYYTGAGNLSALLGAGDHRLGRRRPLRQLSPLGRVGRHRDRGRSRAIDLSIVTDDDDISIEPTLVPPP